MVGDDQPRVGHQIRRREPERAAALVAVRDPRLVVPDHGIYACRAEIDGSSLVAAVNVGVRPTFKTGRGLLVEAFLLDFEGDLYGRELRLVFLSRLRGELKFDSIEELVAQMARDVDDTRTIAA